MLQMSKKCDPRTAEELQRDYRLEKELANRLRGASEYQRRSLYASIYNDYYERVSLKKSSALKNNAHLSNQLKLIETFLNKDATFLEVGAGDGSLSLEVSKYVKQVYAIEVSREITKALPQRQNFHLILTDGIDIPGPKNSIDVAYSDQLMEHIHPDDARVQLQNIYNVLVPRGVYVCITPNKLSGPHDISRYFDKVATGFHLKEYTISELSVLFKEIGFSKVEVYIGAQGIYIKAPLFLLRSFEDILNMLPFDIRLRISRIPLSRLLLGIKLIGIK